MFYKPRWACFITAGTVGSFQTIQLNNNNILMD